MGRRNRGLEKQRGKGWPALPSYASPQKRVKPARSVSTPPAPATHTCQNPFFLCTSPNPQNIALDILYKGTRLSICQDCWTKLAESDTEWSKEPTQTTHK